MSGPIAAVRIAPRPDVTLHELAELVRIMSYRAPWPMSVPREALAEVPFEVRRHLVEVQR